MGTRSAVPVNEIEPLGRCCVVGSSGAAFLVSSPGSFQRCLAIPLRQTAVAARQAAVAAKMHVGPWVYGAKVHPAPNWEWGDQHDGAAYGVTQEPSKCTLEEWLWVGMDLAGSAGSAVEQAWLPCNAQEVLWKGQSVACYYKAGVNYNVRRYDLKFAVAKPPKKDVKRARAVLKRFLLVVSKAEKRGITLYGSKKTLSAYDAKKIRSKVRMSFAHYARK